jgi:redox-sensitive bicupin YhaK (pirin superfamily)
MSWIETDEPLGTRCAIADIEIKIESRPREIEPGLAVGRVLPAAARRQVGPFVFFDQIGPIELGPGRGFDVRPHPHVNLSTVTYLFEGEIAHRDSLGSYQVIRPGAINWMTAGRGIVHSERTTPEERARGPRLHGVQLWVGLPQQEEQGDPAFRHYPSEALPEVEEDKVRLRVLAGSAYGVTSPVQTASSLFFVDATLEAGAQLLLPTGYAERAAYVAKGELACGPERLSPTTLAVFAPGSRPVLRATSATRLLLIGGEPLDGPRYIWWNFVSSSKERIVEAARGWREGRFPKVPGDEVEFVPLHQEPRFPT